MGRWQVVPLGIVLAAALCGCGGSGQPVPTSNAAVASAAHRRHESTLAEVRWVAKVDRWTTLKDKSRSACGRSFRTVVGRPPTDRLRSDVRLTLKACRLYGLAESESGTLKKRHLKTFNATLDQLERHLDTIRPGTEPLAARARPNGESRLDPRYGRAARGVSLIENVRVRCWSRADWQSELRRYSAYVGRPMAPETLGFVVAPRDVNLGPNVCDRLDDLAYGQDRPRNREKIARLAAGVVWFATEIEILVYPHASVAALECYAMQWLKQTAEAIGVDITYSPNLTRVYYRDVYPRNGPGLRSPQCRRGGRLDLDVDYQWP